jgi:hypothetical protein
MTPNPRTALAIGACAIAAFMIGRISTGSSSTTAGETTDNRATLGQTGLHESPGSAQSKRTTRSFSNKPERGSHALPADRLVAMTAIFREPNPLDRYAAWLNFAESLDASQLVEVFTRMRREGMVYEFATEYSMLLAAWAKLDPRGALGGNSGNTFGQQVILRTWATTDPEAAIRWAEENHKGEGANPWMVGVISGLAATDRAQATRLLNATPESTERNQALAAILEHGSMLAPDAALKWVMSIDDERLRGAAMEGIANDLAHADPKGTVDWLLANPSKASAQAMNRAMAQMAKADLQVAIAYLGGITDEAAKSSGFAGVADQMGKQDPRAASQFIEAHPSLASDAIYETLALNALTRDPIFGADQLGKMRDASLQYDAYLGYMYTWLDKDYDGAVAWFAQQKLPAHIQRGLNARIESHPRATQEFVPYLRFGF